MQTAKGGLCLTKRAQTISIVLVLVILLSSTLFLWKSGFFSALSSYESMKVYIERSAPYGQLFFFFIQLLSVILAPIPSNITALAGAVLFGLWQSFLLTCAAVISGSFLMFSLARILGRPFTDRLVSKKISEKYLNIIRSKQDIILFLIFLFPFFPDDVICILAGLTNIRPLRFLIIILISRPWGLWVASAVGSTSISIPLWGMILLGFAGVVVFISALKFGNQIEDFLLTKIKRK